MISELRKRYAALGFDPDAIERQAAAARFMGARLWTPSAGHIECFRAGAEALGLKTINVLQNLFTKHGEDAAGIVIETLQDFYTRSEPSVDDVTGALRDQAAALCREGSLKWNLQDLGRGQSRLNLTVPRALAHKVRAHCRLTGQSLQAYGTELLEREMSREAAGGAA